MARPLHLKHNTGVLLARYLIVFLAVHHSYGRLIPPAASKFLFSSLLQQCAAYEEDQEFIFKDADKRVAAVPMRLTILRMFFGELPPFIIYDGPRSVLFLHDRVSASGQRRIVIVEVDAFGTYKVGALTLHAYVLPCSATQFDPEFIYGCRTTLHRDLLHGIDLQSAKALPFECDEDDPARFSIPINVAGERYRICGELIDLPRKSDVWYDSVTVSLEGTKD